MKASRLPLALCLLSLSIACLAEGSFFGQRHHEHNAHHPNSLTARESSLCGPHHMPCPVAEPCCNNGTCHTTSMESCPIALGCDPRHSYLDSCFALPACRNMKDSFKHAHLLVPKHAFTGDPEQAYWISEFDHIAPYAKINERQKKLLLRTRRDMVRTQSGGGFGATVSSSRWHKYGSFSAKLKSGSTGPGIITAFLLSNPALGEEISFEFTGKDPKKVITNYYRRVPNPAHIDTQGIHRAIIHPHPHQHSHLESHEEIHDLKADSTKQEMLYKIEWTANLIRWSVNGKVIRAVQAGNMVAQGGLPENAMQLQLTIWDAGHAPETMAWSGGKSSYGPDDLYEYVASVSSVEVVCQNPKEGNKPWPGPEATKRLKIAKARAAEQARRFRKMSQNKKVQGSESEEGVFTSAKTFFEIAILTLIKWGLILLSVVCGAAYFTTPKPRTRAPSNPSTSKTNLGLQT